MFLDDVDQARRVALAGSAIARGLRRHAEIALLSIFVQCHQLFLRARRAASKRKQLLRRRAFPPVAQPLSVMRCAAARALLRIRSPPTRGPAARRLRVAKLPTIAPPRVRYVCAAAPSLHLRSRTSLCLAQPLLVVRYAVARLLCQS